MNNKWSFDTEPYDDNARYVLHTKISKCIVKCADECTGKYVKTPQSSFMCLHCRWIINKIIMQFIESKTGDKYEYECTEIFGDIYIESPYQLDATLLDKITVKLMHGASQEGTIENQIYYKFTKCSQWLNDES